MNINITEFHSIRIEWTQRNTLVSHMGTKRMVKATEAANVFLFVVDNKCNFESYMPDTTLISLGKKTEKKFLHLLGVNPTK